MAGRRMHAPHPTPLDPSLAINYINHQESLRSFSHLAPLTLFFLLKSRVKNGGGGEHGTTPSPKYAPALGHQSILLMPI